MKDISGQLLTEVKNYKMPAAAVSYVGQNPPLIICSVTASGKNTVADYIIKNQPNYRETVSHTTRAPRQGEIDGVHYWFVSEAKMLKMVQSQAFIEVKVVHGETAYGTSMESYKTVVAANRRPLLVIDVQGVEEISRAIANLRPFFILPPSYEEWMNRLHSRGVITDEDKAERMASARRELQTVLANPAYILVVNDKVERAAEEILSGKSDGHTQAQNRLLAKRLLEQLNS